MEHAYFMNRCFELAALGFPMVMPNPMVGCVIVCDDKIIGEGFHTGFGKAHAEVNAIASVKDKSLLSKSRLYVNLEPCSHHGKTPPCADLIIESKIPEVIIATMDPNPQVAGKGIQLLKKAGVTVKSGILEKEASLLNRRFLTFYEKKRPYIILKYAQTADGFLADSNNNSKWISNEFSRMLVHKWRGEEMGILVGYNTALVDNPQLNNRFNELKNPLRIVIDPELNLPESLHIFDKSINTLIINYKKEESEQNLSYIQIRRNKELLPQIFEILTKKEIQSVIVEGGAKTLKLFFDTNLWDEARVFTSPGYFGKGIKAPEIKIQPIKTTNSDNDQLNLFINNFK
jgi:diaminohydroxyphosphoribosylaminopyrimidine deaminase/5-amino-6-(5-phosphoribosylamino)uracil reductase